MNTTSLKFLNSLSTLLPEHFPYQKAKQIFLSVCRPYQFLIVGASNHQSSTWLNISPQEHTNQCVALNINTAWMSVFRRGVNDEWYFGVEMVSRICSNLEPRWSLLEKRSTKSTHFSKHKLRNRNLAIRCSLHSRRTSILLLSIRIGMLSCYFISLRHLSCQQLVGCPNWEWWLPLPNSIGIKFIKNNGVDDDEFVDDVREPCKLDRNIWQRYCADRGSKDGSIPVKLMRLAIPMIPGFLVMAGLRCWLRDRCWRWEQKLGFGDSCEGLEDRKSYWICWFELELTDKTWIKVLLLDICSRELFWKNERL